MKLASLICRILLGFVFFSGGLSIFIFHMPPPPPGMAGDFLRVYSESHYIYFVDGIMAIAGALLLANRFVPLALTIAAGIIVNIFIFHITMSPNQIGGGVVVAILWALAAQAHKTYFAVLFVPKPETAAFAEQGG